MTTLHNPFVTFSPRVSEHDRKAAAYDALERELATARGLLERAAPLIEYLATSHQAFKAGMREKATTLEPGVRAFLATATEVPK